MSRSIWTFLCLNFLILVSAPCAFSEEQPQSQGNTNAIAFRKPFTLKLHVDKEHYYEQKFPKIPYVHDGDVYLFKSDSFGIDLDITNGVIQQITYQPDTNKAAVTFDFTQEILDDGKPMMLLVIKNNSKQKLFFDALMTVPDRKNPLKTSILPVGPGLSNYESWPHPIVQLVLHNIRLKEQTSAEPGKSSAKQTQAAHPETNRNASATKQSP